MLHHKSKIFCDMDGVLVDFLGGASSQLNEFLRHTKENGYPEGRKWAKAYRRIVRDRLTDFQIMSEEDLRIPAIRTLMFLLIAKNPGIYFRDLDPMDDGINQLWPFLVAAKRKASLLTAGVPGDPEKMSAKDGKTKWARLHLNPQPRRIIVVPAVTKRQFAIEGGYPNILIDDKLRTIEQWNEDGGLGLLHIPGRSDLTIQNLKKLGV